MPEDILKKLREPIGSQGGYATKDEWARARQEFMSRYAAGDPAAVAAGGPGIIGGTPVGDWGGVRPAVKDSPVRVPQTTVRVPQTTVRVPQTTPGFAAPAYQPYRGFDFGAQIQNILQMLQPSIEAQKTAAQRASQEQFKQSQRNLLNELARRGILRSGQTIEGMTDLTRLTDRDLLDRLAQIEAQALQQAMGYAYPIGQLGLQEAQFAYQQQRDALDREAAQAAAEEAAQAAAEEKAIQRAWDRVKILGYVDNQASQVLGIPVGTPTWQAQNAVEERLHDLRLAQTRAASSGVGAVGLSKTQAVQAARSGLAMMLDSMKRTVGSAGIAGAPQQTSKQYTPKQIYDTGVNWIKSNYANLVTVLGLSAKDIESLLDEVSIMSGYNPSEVTKQKIRDELKLTWEIQNQPWTWRTNPQQTTPLGIEEIRELLLQNR